MSSLLSAIARRVPTAAGSTSGSGVGPRAARTRVVRMLSAGPMRGPSRNGKDSPWMGPPLSALATREFAIERTRRAPSLVYPQQQCRLLSVESDDMDKDDAASEVAVDPPVEEHDEGAEGVAGEETEAAAATKSSGRVFILQMDGIPFSMSQTEIETWLAEAGCTPHKMTIPLWPEGSMRAGQNKGKVYLEYLTEEETQRGVALSGRAVGDRWINVSRLSMPLEETRVITVKGLSGASEDEVAAVLEETVGVAPISVNKVENINRPRALAFASFETPEQARAALALDGTKVQDSWVDVSLHVSKENFRELSSGKMRSPFGTDVPDSRIIMLGGLPFSLVEDEIRAFLANHVEPDDIVEMNVPKYNDTQFNTGVAMFHLASEEAVSVALKLKGTYIGDRWVDVSRWNERGSPNQKTTHRTALEKNRRTIPLKLREKHPDRPVVVMSGIPFDKTEAEMMEFFELNGIPKSSILSFEMPLFLQTQRNTGNCWLVVDDENVYGALMDLNGAALADRWVTVVDA